MLFIWLSNKKHCDRLELQFLWDMFHPFVRIFYHIIESLSFVQPSSISRMFSPQITHIVPLFWLLQRFYWYKFYILRTSYAEKCWSDYWYLTWAETPSPANCRLVVPIVVCQVHHNLNLGGLLHTELNYLHISHLQLRWWWTSDTTIGRNGGTRIWSRTYHGLFSSVLRSSV